LTVDGCSAQAKGLNVLTALTHSCCFTYVGYLEPKEFISRKPVQGLNLNRRSISGLEPEMPVTYVKPKHVAVG
jgi:hypothetical protein